MSTFSDVFDQPLRFLETQLDMKTKDRISETRIRPEIRPRTDEKTMPATSDGRIENDGTAARRRNEEEA